MIRVIMHGCNGKMGRVVCESIHCEKNIEIVAGIDVVVSSTATFPVFSDISSCDMTADVIIDFSVAHALPTLLDYAVKTKTPLVICTTGLDEQSLVRLDEISKEIPVFLSANMSLGVNLILSLAKRAAAVLENAGYDIEIIESHHNQKVDAPSGTAYLLANGINDALGEKRELVTDRSSVREPRGNAEIGMQSIRGGKIVGEHTVMFIGNEEIIEIKHTAQSKDVFAKGAIEAAKFLAGKTPGKYGMCDLV